MVKSAPNVITSLVYNKYWEKANTKTGLPYNFIIFHGAGANGLIADLIRAVIGARDIGAGLPGIMAGVMGGGALVRCDDERRH